MALKWYVVHAYSQYEKKVATAIQERIERLDMQDRFGEIIVPTEEVIEMKGGQKRKSERKFFPVMSSCRWSSTTIPGTSSKTRHGY